MHSAASLLAFTIFATCVRRAPRLFPASVVQLLCSGGLSGGVAGFDSRVDLRIENNSRQIMMIGLPEN